MVPDDKDPSKVWKIKEEEYKAIVAHQFIRDKDHWVQVGETEDQVLADDWARHAEAWATRGYSGPGLQQWKKENISYTYGTIKTKCFGNAGGVKCVKKDTAA